MAFYEHAQEALKDMTNAFHVISKSCSSAADRSTSRDYPCCVRSIKCEFFVQLSVNDI